MRLTEWRRELIITKLINVLLLHDYKLLSNYFLAPQYSIPEGEILKTKQVRPQRHLLGGESAVERYRISPLESHRQPLEQVCCFPGVFSDGLAPAPIPLLGGSRSRLIVIIILLLSCVCEFWLQVGVLQILHSVQTL